MVEGAGPAIHFSRKALVQAALSLFAVLTSHLAQVLAKARDYEQARAVGRDAVQRALVLLGLRLGAGPEAVGRAARGAGSRPAPGDDGRAWSPPSC